MPHRILIIDDEERMRWVLCKALEQESYEAEAAGDGIEGLKMLDKHSIDLVLLDMRLPIMDGMEVLKRIKELYPSLPVIIITAYGSIEMAVAAVKAGATDYITKPFDIDELVIQIKKALDVHRLVDEVEFLRSELSQRYQDMLLSSKSPCMQEVYELVRRIADSDATVLLTGESGTGKEVIARTIHYSSRRADKPFVAINCAAVPDNLLESELFGYEKGAFTGAVARKAGRFEVADGGTVFLDEIGEMSMNMQAKLLRVLQERSFEHLGGNDVISVDVRIIAATNKDLQYAMKSGYFREDLYYRLSVIPINLPPLRERKEDIPDLALYFVNKFDKRKAIKGISKQAMDILRLYSWPGNIRELENAIERAVIICDTNAIQPAHLPISMQTPKKESSVLDIDIPDEGISMEALEMQLIKKALDKTGGNQTKAAKLLGITRSALIYRMQHGIT
ncbi:two component, sigma54 specific, transcriptional regulator, Fis family [Mahella australiensis 50-1 BON]|uniref:Stage 0 sporulation protein A homolog n=2 Tax=Mahella TaxID=252965 RepID=F3ZYE9_MAHA5|nr:two component, sigma54 specific, transcriptional regulator, Fis family [Mahella australiensis 50-1 BON]